MQIRVKNLNKGGRGVWVGGEMVEIDGNSTGTFTGATADERDAAAKVEGLKVQSSNDSGKTWTDHFKEEMPEERPWLALATDASGNNFKPIADGTWYVGMAVAGERPDGAASYKWIKVGGDVEADKPAKVDAATVSKPVPATVDYAKLVEGTAPDVIAAVTKDNASQIGDAEEKREGGSRKGVMKAVEEAMA